MALEFDDVLEELWGSGWYQKRLVYFLLCGIFFFTPFAFLNQVFVLHMPDHWCTPPDFMSPERLKISLDEWKQKFLPIEIGPDYQPRPSQCSMYKVDNRTLRSFLAGRLPDNDTETVPCLSYEYDRSDMYDTAVTDNDWVCDKATRATDLYTTGTAGLIVGVFLFSAFADYKGRRPAFFICTALCIVFNIIPIWVSHSYTAFVVLKVLAFGCMMPLFQSPLGITTEISSVKYRGMVIGLACMAWSVGMILMPLLAYLVNRWKILRVVSVVPLAYVFLCWTILPESPRWLLTKKKVSEAKEILVKVAKVNKVDVPKDLEEKLTTIANAKGETTYGYISLLSTWRLAWRTTAVTIAFTSSAFVYYQLIINIANLHGDLFINMFLMGLVEGPGCVLGFVAGDKFGRRWSHTLLLLCNGILFFVLMWVAYDPDLSGFTIFLCMFIKMNISGTFVLAYMQAMEIFPTCVRQSGLGFATLISQMICIGGPYVIYLGATDLKLPYAVMFLVCIAGFVATLFLPETLDRKLPETIEEASSFGAKDKFFSFRPGRYERARERDEEDETAEAGDMLNKKSGGDLYPSLSH